MIRSLFLALITPPLLAAIWAICLTEKAWRLCVRSSRPSVSQGLA